MKSQVITIVLATALLALMLTVSIQGIEAKTYKHPTYTVDYPGGCKLVKGGKYETGAFNVECKGNIGIQIESGSDFGTYFTGTTPQENLDDLITVTESGFDTSTVESGVDKYTVGNQSVSYAIGTYEQEFTNFLGLPAEGKDWVLFTGLIDLGNDQKIVFEYRNDAKSFDEDLPFALKVMESIQSTGVVQNDTSSSSSADSRADNALDALCKYPTFKDLDSCKARS